jgi:SAM-dependent methyltransferase
VLLLGRRRSTYVRAGPRGSRAREQAGAVDDAGLPPWFFERADPAPDRAFYATPRLVAHLDAAAIEAVGLLYEEVGVGGHVLDLMSSWISHLRTPPAHLTVLGLNAVELAANAQASAALVHDLNATPALPFAAAAFDAALCCVSVDYLVRPLEVFADVARVLRPGAPFVCTFSNRCFPTKAIAGWLQCTDELRSSWWRSTSR